MRSIIDEVVDFPDVCSGAYLEDISLGSSLIQSRVEEAYLLVSEDLVLTAVVVPGGPCSPCGPCGLCGPVGLPSKV